MISARPSYENLKNGKEALPFSMGIDYKLQSLAKGHWIARLTSTHKMGTGQFISRQFISLPFVLRQVTVTAGLGFCVWDSVWVRVRVRVRVWARIMVGIRMKWKGSWDEISLGEKSNTPQIACIKWAAFDLNSTLKIQLLAPRIIHSKIKLQSFLLSYTNSSRTTVQSNT